MSDYLQPMDCSLPGSSIPGNFQARVLKGVAISFPRGSSRPRDQTWVSRTAGRFFSVRATREAHLWGSVMVYMLQGRTRTRSGWWPSGLRWSQRGGKTSVVLSGCGTGMILGFLGGHSSIPAWRIPVERGAWQATVHGVTESRTRLKRLSTHAQVWH